MSNVIYIGSFADIDPNEVNNYNSENAASLVGRSYSEADGMRYVSLTPNDASGSQSHIIGDNDYSGANAGGDTVSYDLGTGTVTERLDSTIWVNANVTQASGNPLPVKVALIQTESGKLFIAEDYNYPGQLDNVSFQSIQITGIRQSNTTGWVYENQTGTTKYSIDGGSIVCFAAGSLITTINGSVAVEKLRPGDLVLTMDHGHQAIRWIGARHLDTKTLAACPNLRPVRISKGALGEGLPERDLMVSPQHRVLVRSKIAQRLFGTNEVLVAAKHLLVVDGINIDDSLSEVDYFHLLFDDHQILFSNGAATESLYMGPMALQAVGQAALEEVHTLFPELRDRDLNEKPAGVRLLLSGGQGRKLARRHARSGKSLMGEWRAS